MYLCVYNFNHYVLNSILNIINHFIDLVHPMQQLTGSAYTQRYHSLRFSVIQRALQTCTPQSSEPSGWPISWTVASGCQTLLQCRRISLNGRSAWKDMLVGTFAGPVLDSFTSGTMISCARIWDVIQEERRAFLRNYSGSMALVIMLIFTPRKTRRLAAWFPEAVVVWRTYFLICVLHILNKVGIDVLCLYYYY